MVWDETTPWFQFGEVIQRLCSHSSIGDMDAPLLLVRDDRDIVLIRVRVDVNVLVQRL